VASSSHDILMYQAVNSVNGKRYIGITKVGLHKRANRHRMTARWGGGAVFGSALRKHGEAIQFHPLVVCPDFEYAKMLEVATIERLQPEYNVTKGGDGCHGYRHTDSHRSRIGNLQRGNKHWLGKKHSAETILKMRETRLTYWKGRKKPKLKKEKKPKRGRLIQCIDTGEVFPSLKEASRQIGKDHKSILYVCRGTQKTVGGLKFRFLDGGGAQTHPGG